MTCSLEPGGGTLDDVDGPVDVFLADVFVAVDGLSVGPVVAAAVDAAEDGPVVGLDSDVVAAVEGLAFDVVLVGVCVAGVDDPVGVGVDFFFFSFLSSSEEEEEDEEDVERRRRRLFFPLDFLPLLLPLPRSSSLFSVFVSSFGVLSS